MDVDSVVNVQPQVDMLILMDRSVDIITPLLTQLTYEGLIDATWGINSSLPRFPHVDSLNSLRGSGTCSHRIQ